MKLFKLALLMLLSSLQVSTVLAQDHAFDGSTVQSVVYDPSGGVPVAKAAQLLVHDLTALRGTAPAITSSVRQAKGLE